MFGWWKKKQRTDLGLAVERLLIEKPEEWVRGTEFPYEDAYVHARCRIGIWNSPLDSIFKISIDLSDYEISKLFVLDEEKVCSTTSDDNKAIRRALRKINISSDPIEEKVNPPNPKIIKYTNLINDHLDQPPPRNIQELIGGGNV